MTPPSSDEPNASPVEPNDFQAGDPQATGGEGEEVVASPAAAEASPYAKPNLVLSDPDPYAFANRIRRLTLIFALLATIAATPYLVGQLSYYWRAGQKRADYDIAGEQLTEAAFRMGDFNRVSRLIAERVSPSVVSISRQGADPRGRGNGQGSGVIVDTDGYILTNYHVVEDARGLFVQLDDGRVTDANLVGADPATDLAVLKISLPNLIAAEWGDSDEAQVGDMVWAVGSPFGLARSLTFGILSAKERRSGDNVRTASIYQEYLQADVAINPGNSGGPLVDVEGKVVGINTAIIGEAYAGISFAIPTTIAREKFQQLRNGGSIERGFLGVAPGAVTERARRRLKLDRGVGVLINSVEPGGPADRGGIQPGDVILSWNGKQASDPTILSRDIAATDIGSTAEVKLKRRSNDQVVELPVQVRVGRRR